MKIPFFPSIGAGDPGSVVALALHELGLNEDFLIRAVLAAKGNLEFKNGEINYDKIGCFEWIWICKKLYLPLDSYSYGYSRCQHRAAVGEAILDRSFVLPLTAQAKALFREYLGAQRYSYRREKEFYGDQLLRKVIRKRIEERRERKLVRALNLRVGRPAREKYQRLFVQSSLGAPLMMRNRKRSPRKGLQSQHGLRVDLQGQTESTNFRLE